MFADTENIKVLIINKNKIFIFGLDFVVSKIRPTLDDDDMRFQVPGLKPLLLSHRMPD